MLTVLQRIRKLAICVVAILGLSVFLSDLNAGELSFVRGDSNNDTEVDIADPVHTLFAEFLGGPASVCPDAADVNGVYYIARDVSPAKTQKVRLPIDRSEGTG